MFTLFSSCNLILDCLLQEQHKKDERFYKVFNSYDLALLFYSIYLCFILDQKTNVTVYILNDTSSFLLNITNTVLVLLFLRRR